MKVNEQLCGLNLHLDCSLLELLVQTGIILFFADGDIKYCPEL